MSEFIKELETASDDTTPEGKIIFGDQAEQLFQLVKGEELLVKNGE